MSSTQKSKLRRGAHAARPPSAVMLRRTGVLFSAARRKLRVPKDRFACFDPERAPRCCTRGASSHTRWRVCSPIPVFGFKWANEVFGGPPNTAGRRPALPSQRPTLPRSATPDDDRFRVTCHPPAAPKLPAKAGHPSPAVCPANPCNPPVRFVSKPRPILVCIPQSLAPQPSTTCPP